jgi:hypothetical protein
MQLKSICGQYLERVHAAIDCTSEAIRELLGCDGVAPADEVAVDAPGSARVRFFSKLQGQASASDYSNRLARFVRLLLTLTTVTGVCEVVKEAGHEDVLGARILQAVKSFESSLNDDMRVGDALHKLLCSVVAVDTGLGGKYSDYPCCVFVVAELSDAHGLFTRVATSAKSISAVKYFLRGCLLLQAQVELQGSRVVRDYTELACLKYAVQQGRGTRSGSTNTLSVLSRMAKAVNVFSVASKPKVLFFEHTASLECTVNNKPCSMSLVANLIDDLTEQAHNQTNQLLLGVTLDEWELDSDPSDCAEYGFAFGRSANIDSETLKRHAMATTRLRKHFWKRDKTRKLNVVDSGNAVKYLNQCLRLEADLAVLLHALTGFGARGTDFAFQTYRNSGANDSGDLQTRNVTVVTTPTGEQVLQFAAPVSKTSLLHGKQEDVLRFVDVASVPFLFAYYLVIRPFALYLRNHMTTTKRIAQTTIDRLGSPWRWSRFMYVKSSTDSIRTSVEKSIAPFSRGLKYNELRHFSVAVHRHFVTPQELSLQQNFPVHQGFGHAKSTDVSYGAGTFASNTGGCEPTSVLRCSKLWWQLLDNAAAQGVTSRESVVQHNHKKRKGGGSGGNNTDKRDFECDQGSSDSESDGDDESQGSTQVRGAICVCEFSTSIWQN